MRRIERGGVDGIKNRSEKCRGPDERVVDRLKNRSEKCEGSNEKGIDGLKNWSAKCEGPGRGGGKQWLFEKKSFF
jgi:hypothetical protein